MCKWGTYVEMPLQVWINSPDYPMELELKDRYIDACISPLIQKLNQNQVLTLNSCCGHQDYDDGIVNTYDGYVVIDPASCRHADSMGYYVFFTSDFAEIKLDNIIGVDGS